MSTVRVVRRCFGIRKGLGIGRTSVRHSFVRHVVAAGLAATLAAGVVLTATAPASARVPSRPCSLAAASSRLEALSAQANTLSANLPATRTAQVAAETEAAAQRARLFELGKQVQVARAAVGQQASGSYIGDGGSQYCRAVKVRTRRRDHQRQTGSALCVTEGYRSYAEQVAVKQRLPGLAATRGSSKHGLGLAVDLCGGVQDFAKAAHLWLKRNGSHFGWFHPAWAEPSGGLPEPWHWEFGGGKPVQGCAHE